MKKGFLLTLLSLCIALCVMLASCGSYSKKKDRDDDDDKTEKTKNSQVINSSTNTTDSSDTIESSDTTESSDDTTESSDDTTESSEPSTDDSEPDVGDEPCAEHKGGNATCTQKAVCETCGEEYGDLAPHTEEVIPSVDATCTETGLTEGKRCSVCGEITVEQAVTEALGHNYGDDNICDRCDAERVSGGLEFELSSNGTYYIVTGIGTCTDTEVIIPSSYNGLPVKAIGRNAFLWCDTFTTIEIPGSVTTIESGAFECCLSSARVIIREGVTTIGEGAFAFSNIASIEIPSSVTEIGAGAFNCFSPESITVHEENATYKLIDGSLYTKDGTTLVKYVESGYNTSFVIPNSVTTIGDGAFSCCWQITRLEIPDSVTTIGALAFASSGIKSIVIPNSVTAVDYHAFWYCDFLTVYCEAEEKPSGWESDWNPDLRPVVWGHTHSYVDGECVCGANE